MTPGSGPARAVGQRSLREVLQEEVQRDTLAISTAPLRAQTLRERGQRPVLNALGPTWMGPPGDPSEHSRVSWDGVTSTPSSVTWIYFCKREKARPFLGCRRPRSTQKGRQRCRTGNRGCREGVGWPHARTEQGAPTRAPHPHPGPPPGERGPPGVRSALGGAASAGPRGPGFPGLRLQQLGEAAAGRHGHLRGIRWGLS